MVPLYENLYKDVSSQLCMWEGWGGAGVVDQDKLSHPKKWSFFGPFKITEFISTFNFSFGHLKAQNLIF